MNFEYIILVVSGYGVHNNGKDYEHAGEGNSGRLRTTSYIYPNESVYLAMPNNQPPAPGKYIDLLVDFSFKKVFGSEPNKDLLIAFLNEVFRGRKQIVDLVYNKNEHPGDLKEEGAAIFDLLCTGDKGEQFIIEVQRGKQVNFKERALFYASRLIGSLAPRGRREEWAYNLPEVYLVAILEDFTLPLNPAGAYLHNIVLCNRETGEVFYDKLNFTYIELRNFDKTEAELETDLERWLYLLKNLHRLDKLSVYFRKPIFEKLFDIAEYTNLTKEEKTMYDSSLKYKWDNKNVLDYAKLEGEMKREREIALKLKNEGLSFEFIAKTTGLSIEEIERL